MKAGSQKEVRKVRRVRFKRNWDILSEVSNFIMIMNRKLNLWNGMVHSSWNGLREGKNEPKLEWMGLKCCTVILFSLHETGLFQ